MSSALLVQFAGFPIEEDPTAQPGTFKIGPSWFDRVLRLGGGHPPPREVIAVHPGEIPALRAAIETFNLTLPPRLGYE